MCRDPISDPQGGPWTFFSVPWGARWTPPRPQVPSDVIKRAHPTRNSAGSSVGSLAAPRATPRLGGVCVLCLQYFPCSFMYSPCASSAFDWGSKPDSRSAPAPAPVESSPGLVLLPVAVIGFRAVGISRLEAPNRDPGLCTASQPCAESPKLLPSPTKSRGDGAWACFRHVLENGSHRSVPIGLFHRI
jgi:hypothetical protein